jgi:tetratricopeptide (TPR) repeat protein
MLEAGRREEARRLFTEAAGRPARDARAANNLARMYLEEGRPELARPWADKAIRREPDLAAAYLNRAAIARVEGRFEPARADLERARALEPGLPEVALEEGYLAAARGDWNGAIERYRAVLAARPNHVPALIALAQAYRELGRDAEAAQALLRAKSLAANS